MNKDTIFCLVIAAGIFWLVLNFPIKPVIRDRKPLLPINLYTNGVADGNTNDVASRVNFRQQPYG